MKANEFPPKFPVPWACEWGEHRTYGLFMILEVKGVHQCFRWMPPGTFMMGSPETEIDRFADETQHEVTLTQGFWLADTACTQALWQEVMGENPSHFKGNPNNWVENVSWEDTQHFIARLNQLFPDLAARLPTEAEWEYACRAGTTTPFSFGDNITPEQVNYDGNRPYADGKKGVYREKTVPVKSLPANPWGLYEMHGNVWEWCQDWFSQYPNKPVIDPTGVETGDNRVLRGGFWNDGGRGIRSAVRVGNRPGYRDGDIGFRLALGRSGASSKTSQ